MGYQSDVAYTIRFKNEEDYRLFILEAKADPLKAGCFKSDDSQWEEVECDDQRYRIDFKADSVKWYESYPDVDMHERLIQQAREWVADDDSTIERGEKILFSGRDYRLGYAYVRIGEDVDDNVEEHGGYSEYDWVCIRRSIEWG